MVRGVNVSETTHTFAYEHDISGTGNGREALSPIGSPIVLQRRGSVYGANVPMITGKLTNLIYNSKHFAQIIVCFRTCER